MKRTTDHGAGHVASLFFASLAFVFFFVTSAPGIGTEDSGELAAGARLLTMVHAPGYPLYLLAGRLACAISDEPGRGLVLFSVLCGAAAVGLMHFVVGKEMGPSPAAAAALAMTFCKGLWQASTEVEVYALQALLLTAILGVLLWIGRERPPDDPVHDDPAHGVASRGKAIRILCLLVGLMLAHSVGFLIMLPAVAAYCWYVTRSEPQGGGTFPLPASRFPLRIWLPGLGYFAAGLGLYSALLCLSWRGDIPIIWWERITTLPQLLHVASGAGFRKLLFAVPRDQVLKNLITFPFGLFMWFPVICSLLALVGIYAVAKRNIPLFLLLAWMMGITIFHAANYNVLDPEVFLMPAVPAVAFLTGWGFRFLSEKIQLTSRSQLFLVIMIGLLGVAGRIAEGGLMATAFNTFPSDIAQAVLRSHEGRDGDIIWTDWKFFPTLRYFQIVEGLGRKTRLDFDSTSETPGSIFEAGKTYTMRASYPLGRTFALVMTDLHWKVELTAETPVELGGTSSPQASRIFGGIEILAIDTPARVTVGEPINCCIVFRRTQDAGGPPDDAVHDHPASDTVSGFLMLLRNGFPRLTTPLALLHWHSPPSTLEKGRIYAEPVQTMIPTSHRDEPGSIFSLVVKFETSRDSVQFNLGDLKIDRAPGRN